MVYAIHNRDILKFKRVNPFHTTNIETIFFWIRSSLVVCINTALRTKIVLSCHCVKLIQSQIIKAFNNF